MKKLSQISGFYEPSFFRLHIETMNSIKDVNSLNDVDFSTFIHEYIHFIQDTATYYGLNNIYYNIEYLRYANNAITGHKLNPFTVPVYPKADNSDNVLLNGHICKLTFGDTGAINHVQKINTYTISKLPIDIPNNSIAEIDVIDVEAIDTLNNDHCFSFGAGCIIESMAYLFEKITCNNYPISPDIPYNSAELIVDHIFPEFGENKLNILALCDVSLNISNPAKYFITKLEEYKNKHYVPLKAEDLYTEFLGNPLTVNNGQRVNFQTHYNSLSDRVNSQLKGYFNDAHFNTLKEWIDQVMDVTKTYRLNNPSFIIDLAKGKMKENNYFKKLFNDVGTPLMTNTTNEFRFYHPLAFSKQIDIGYFWAISQIKNVFWGTSQKCEMKEMCNQPISNTKTDIRCDTEPWKRCNDNDLCPFALVWRHWGLANYEPSI